MNKKIVFSSILTLVLCVSLITGATFALFTSDSETNIAVNSGKVDVEAVFSVADVYSPAKIDTNCVVTDTADASNGNIFANGGTVTVDGEQVTITNMTPGDKVIFKIDITNSTNVEFMQRIMLGFLAADKAFFDQLLIGISDTVDGTYTYYAEYATAWEKGEAVSAPTTTTKYLSVEMPACVGNDMQEKSCTFALAVHAVQGNANVNDAESAKIVTVTDAAGLAAAVNGAADGAIIYLTEPAGTVDIAYDAANTVTLRGYNIEKLNVNAPNGTLHVYNNVETLTGSNVAQHSLYVYGKVGSLEVNSGRIVVEHTAQVEKITLAPVANAKVALVIPEITVEDKILVGEVASIVVPEIASGATVNIKVSESVDDSIISGAGKENADVIVGDSFVPDEDNQVLYIGDAAGLRQFAAEVNGGATKYKNWTVKLTANIDLAGENWTPINAWDGILNGVVIDGDGYSIKNMTVDGGDSIGFISNNASNLTIKNVTFDNAYVKTTDGNTKYAGVVMGKSYSPVVLENITVINSQVRCTWQCGGFVGFAEGNAPVFTSCTIKDSFVGGVNCTSGAFFGLGKVDLALTSCSAENVDLYTDMDPGYAGYLYGKQLTATDCTLTNVIVVSTYPAN